MAVATFDPATQIGQSWREASRLLSIMAFALAGLCVAVYAALARALRPTRAIGAGLKQLAANDLSARLPRFDLAELSAISGVFNTLAERLQTTLAERNALTRKLIEVQDEERRHLARELHDEFGQSLSAIAAQAAAAAHTAERECPPLYEECRGISRTTAHMMETLRGALVRLRPPDVEELGLTSASKAWWRAGTVLRRAARDLRLPSLARPTICRPASAPVFIGSRRRRSPMRRSTRTPGACNCASRPETPTSS